MSDVYEEEFGNSPESIQSGNMNVQMENGHIFVYYLVLTNAYLHLITLNMIPITLDKLALQKDTGNHRIKLK